MMSIILSVTVFLGTLSLGLSTCPDMETDVTRMPDCEDAGMKMECNFVEDSK